MKHELRQMLNSYDRVKVKLKLTLFLIKHITMKMNGGAEM
jgi:hypothetical protein